jgi:hypothetical protein
VKEEEQEQGENEDDVGYYTFKFVDRVVDGILRRKIPSVNSLENNDVLY